MYNLLANVYYSFLVFRNYVRSSIFLREIPYKNIPIIINNRNRVTFLKQLVSSLKAFGYNNIIILDNDSTYLPLLDFYKTTDCKIIFLEKNLGFDALEKISLYKSVRKNYFVYTDSDVVPANECPEDFLKVFYETLRKYPKVQKVGFSLKIDDLPISFKDRERVISWESAFYKTKINDNLYEAPIDTTFALHRPYATLSTKGRYKMIRTSFPYTAKHMPWYNDSENLSEEESYYIKHVEIGTHWAKGLGVKNKSFIKRIFRKN